MEPAEISVPPSAALVRDDQRTLATNASVLLAGQVLGMVAPLITVPYLARVLGPAGWGPVLMAQALANWLVMILEFAFDLSGTRAVARSRHEPDSTATVVQAVQSAKVLLVLVTVPVALLVALWIPTLRASPPLIAAALCFAVGRGLSPLWYFQGLERLRGAVAIDSSTRLAAALAVFWLVRTPEHGWRVVALQAVFSFVALAWLTMRLVREVALTMPSAAEGWRMIRKSSTVFACRASSGIYIQANVLIVGVIAPAAVGFFGGAERIVRAAINLLQPFNQAFLPRISYLHRSDPHAADRVVRQGFLVMGGIGAAMSLTAVAGAPLLVRVLLGPAYGAAVPIVRLMAVLPLLVSINGVLGIFWAVPFGRERGFLSAILAAGATNLTLAALLVPRYGPAGMALAAVAAEIAVFCVLMTLYARR